MRGYTIIDVLIVLIVLAILAVIGATFHAWYDQHKAEKIEIVKSDWTCTQDHQEEIVTHILVGKILVPQIRVTTVCDKYERIAR